jgi:Fuc2NAc and GlcNAc transferase
MLPVLLIALVVATWLSCHLYRNIALHFHFFDHPNERSAHTEPTPTGAGIVMVIGFYLVLSIASQQQLIATNILMATFGGLPVAAIGFIDDRKKLHWSLRAVIHLLAAAWCIYYVGFPTLIILGTTLDTGTASLVFGVIALVWLLNLYNFMDGIDGIAASETVFVCGAAAFLSGFEVEGWGLINLLLMAVSLGFLIINWPKAKLFMGDVGSGFLGLTLGVLILAYNEISVLTWMILLGYFVTDACLTIVLRLVHRENITESHSQHAYQHLTRVIGDAKTLYLVILINMLWLFPIAILSVRFPEYGVLLLLLAALPLLLAEFICGAGQDQPRLKRLRV